MGGGLFFILQTFDPSGVEDVQENPAVLTFHVFEKATSVKSFAFVKPVIMIERRLIGSNTRESNE